MKKLLLLSVLLLTTSITEAANANPCNDLQGAWLGELSTLSQSSSNSSSAVITLNQFNGQYDQFFIKIEGTGSQWSSLFSGSCASSGTLTFSAPSCFSSSSGSTCYLCGSGTGSQMLLCPGIVPLHGSINDGKITFSATVATTPSSFYPYCSTCSYTKGTYTFYKADDDTSSTTSWPTSAIVTASTVGAAAIVGWGLYVYNRYVLKKKGSPLLMESTNSNPLQ